MPPLASFVVVAAIAASSGGYYPTTWNWAAFFLGGTAAVATLLRGRLTLSRPELVTLSALILLGCWIGLSGLWTESVPSTILEAQRVLLYVMGALVVVAGVPVVSVPGLLGGAWAAITGVSLFALATRLFPDRVESFDPVSVYRLSQPIGYWNALGMFSVMGILLGLAFAARGERQITRSLAAASLVVLTTTLYFTFSRGAWAALICGIAVAVALDARRLQLITTTLVVALPAAVAVWLASRLHGLTRAGSSLEQATHDGRKLAPLLLILAGTALALSPAQGAVARRVRLGRNAKQVYALVLILALCGFLALAMARYGGPWTMAHRAEAAFTAPPETSKDLNARVFTLSSNGRTTTWRQAWRDYLAHPLLGSGAGTYEIWYLRHRTGDLKVRDAHSLYLETLAELGPLGLTLLLVMLLTPLAAAVKARRKLLVPIAAAAYVAFVLHAGVDWDWEMSGVTLTGLLCGVSLLVAARNEMQVTGPMKAIRPVAVALAVAGAVLAVVALLGNVPASKAAREIQARHWHSAAAQAAKEIRWAPWSADGWRRLGQAHVGENRLPAAERELRKAIAREPNAWERWFDLALATTGAPQRDALDRALALNPRSPEIREFVAGVGLKGILPSTRRT